MQTAVTREVKNNERRVAITPPGARELVSHSHQVGAGVGSSIPDEEYVAAGAGMPTADGVWAFGKLVLKVKEPVVSVFSFVANMPGAVPHTSTYAPTNVTLPCAVEIAERGLVAACAPDPALALGVNAVAGQRIHGTVAQAHGLTAAPLAEVLD